LLGVISTLPPLLIQWKAADIRSAWGPQSVWSYAWFAYIVVGVSEETSKFLMLRYYAYPKEEFKGALDGIVYSVMIAMGFATFENIEYVERLGLSVGISRFFLSVPAHAAFAVLMGYNVGLAKTLPSRAGWLMWKGLLIAVLFHGSFDFFLFLQQNEQVKRYVSEGLLSFGAFATFYVAIRLAMRTIRMHKSY
jgi:RsiW-degrading membrane proteinase PrsW (M82 family)